MPKLAYTILFIVIIVCGLAFAYSLHFGMAQTTAQVSGIINSDTTWTHANGPYNLTGNILVNDGVTLTIQVGTTINLNIYYIRVNGSIIIQPGVTINLATIDASIQVNGLMTAIGASDNPININGATGSITPVTPATYPSINFAPSGSESIIENSVINSTNINAFNSLKINSDTINGAAMSFSGGSPIITNSKLMTSIDFSGGSPTVFNNTMNTGFISLSNGNNSDAIAIITDNIISDAKTSVGLTLAGIETATTGQVFIERNLITNSFAGIEVGGAKNGSIIQDNTIANNSIGISVTSPYPPTIINNNIYNNNYNLKLSQQASNNINVTDNWWGTTDQQAINQSIYDFKNDFNLGTANFVPFLSTPNSQATPNPNGQIPTPNPATSPTPTPATPEYPSSIIVTSALLITALIISIFKLKKVES